VKPGQTLKAEIIGVDTAERKIGLSFRGATRAEELADAQGFTSGVPTATLGDVMRDKLAALTRKTAEDSGEKQGQGKKKGKGADAVLVNTAIAIASDPVRMAKAFKKAIEAGREAREIGLADKLHAASATSPLTGFLSR